MSGYGMMTDTNTNTNDGTFTKMTRKVKTHVGSHGLVYGIVGGLAVTALIAVAIFLVIWYLKKDKTIKSSSAGSMMPVSSSIVSGIGHRFRNVQPSFQNQPEYGFEVNPDPKMGEQYVPSEKEINKSKFEAVQLDE